MLIPYTDPNLLKNDASDISVSPFTLLFERAGFAAAAGVMNAVILSAILSAGNSGMYASTRMLYNLALEEMCIRDRRRSPSEPAGQLRGVPGGVQAKCGEGGRGQAADQGQRQLVGGQVADQYHRYVGDQHAQGLSLIHI